MNLACDPSLDNSAYPCLYETTAHAGTFHPSDKTNADIVPHGTVCGIRLLNAHQRLRFEDQGNWAVAGKVAAGQREIPLG